MWRPSSGGQGCRRSARATPARERRATVETSGLTKGFARQATDAGGAVASGRPHRTARHVRPDANAVGRRCVIGRRTVAGVRGGGCTPCACSLHPTDLSMRHLVRGVLGAEPVLGSTLALLDDPQVPDSSPRPLHHGTTATGEAVDACHPHGRTPMLLNLAQRRGAERQARDVPARSADCVDGLHPRTSPLKPVAWL